MDNLITIFTWIGANYTNIIAASTGVIAALIVLFQIIPGNEPENTLKKIVALLEKYSKK